MCCYCVFLTSNYFWRCPRAKFSLAFRCSQTEVSRVAPLPPSREFAPEWQFSDVTAWVIFRRNLAMLHGSIERGRKRMLWWLWQWTGPIRGSERSVWLSNGFCVCKLSLCLCPHLQNEVHYLLFKI